MALVIVVETGEGLPTANSYVSRAECTAFHEGHVYPELWTAATDAKKDAAIVMATRVIDTEIQFNGYKKSELQALQWPRRYCPDPDLERSLIFGPFYYSPRAASGSQNYVDEAIVPPLIKWATCEMARKLLEKDRTAVAAYGDGIKSIDIANAISIEFDAGVRESVLTRETISMLNKYGRTLGNGFVKLQRT